MPQCKTCYDSGIAQDGLLAVEGGATYCSDCEEGRNTANQYQKNPGDPLSPEAAQALDQYQEINDSPPKSRLE